MLTRRYGYGFILRVSILAFSLVIIGCAKPPTMEIEKAEKAVAEAKQKEADLYAQDIFSRSEEALKKAKDSWEITNIKRPKPQQKSRSACPAVNHNDRAKQSKDEG